MLTAFFLQTSACDLIHLLFLVCKLINARHNKFTMTAFHRIPILPAYLYIVDAFAFLSTIHCKHARI